MKFRHINIENLRNLLPSWAGHYMQYGRSADEALSRHLGPMQPDPFVVQKFSLYFDTQRGIVQVHTPEDGDDEFMGAFIIEARNWKIDFQINYALKSYLSITGLHCVYSHGLLTDVPVGYIGISKRPWFVRYAEHEAAARNGSRFLFHEALRRHGRIKNYHRVMLAGLDLETAMDMEERLVSACTLYPLGVNMIPGGKAGLRYLSSLSLQLTSTEHVPETIAREMDRPSTEGRPNPLCSARWESDPDYTARVICGHSGRLTVEQVQMIRAMHVACREPTEIAQIAGAKNIAQVKRLLSAKTYSRIA